MAARTPFNRLITPPPVAVSGPATEIAAMTLHDLATALRRGRLSSREATQACLDRIATHDGRDGLNAFITVDAEGALAQARRCDELAAKREYLGPLHGVPIAIKDALDTAGLRTTGGAKVFERRVPHRDAPVVHNLRHAGAVVLGKTNLHECSYGITSNNPHYGPVRNPHDRSRIPGGSSGGSGAAVAAGLCAGAVGTDTGGSVRIPAALCGGVGFKPTLGRLDVAGMMGLSWTCDVAGPMTRSVADAVIMLQAMAAPARDKLPALPAPSRLGNDAAYLRGLRIGVPRAHVTAGNAPAVDACMQATEARLRELGALIVDVDVPGIERAIQQGFAIVVPESMVLLERYWSAQHPARSLRDDIAYFGADFGGVVASELGGSAQPVPAHVYVETLRVGRELLRAAFLGVLGEVDVMLMPTTPAPAVPIAEDREMTLNGERLDTFATFIRYTFSVSLAGLPAISVPGGRNADGLPLGVQFVAAPWREDTLAHAAHAFELASTD
jgi:Asp-tRNA(Asn)/Glu-tRNA(Gln) amidotransferase A subunit family amidase